MPGSLRTIALALILALPIVLAGCVGRTLTSTTSIPPADTFELGGGQVGDFRVEGRNSGPVSVEVLAVTGDSTTSLGTFAPGAAIDHTFSNGQLAKFRNTSATEQAEVKVLITGNTGQLGMKYQGK